MNHFGVYQSFTVYSATSFDQESRFIVRSHAELGRYLLSLLVALLKYPGELNQF